MHDFLSERPLAQRCLKLTARRANAVIAISRSVAEDTRRVLPSIRIETLLNAVDVKAFSPGPSTGTELDRLSGLKVPLDRTLRIGLVATYARWKGQDVFLRAAARVHRTLPSQHLRFYVIGGPIYATDASQFSSAELNALIGELGLWGTAGLIPFQRELLSVLRSLDIFVHASSRPEPFGRSIVEAMACSRPIVVAAGGGAGEIVDAGRTGLTHAPGDVDGLAAALRTLIESEPLRDRLAVEGRRVAIERFSRVRLGPALIALYLSLL
jgi:glycosyltransferase involved in cell wall biosynthesis